MRLITIDEARDHCKADGDDDEQLAVYANAAEAMCARLANRSLFATTEDLNAAVATVATRMAAAYSTYDAAIAAADEQDDDRIISMMKAQAQVALNNATLACENDLHGLAIDAAGDEAGIPGNDAIKGAILFLTAHYYSTRPAVITGQSAAAVEVPQSTADIMALYRWIGPECV
jgi:hypothetical protein